MVPISKLRCKKLKKRPYILCFINMYEICVCMHYACMCMHLSVCTYTFISIYMHTYRYIHIHVHMIAYLGNFGFLNLKKM